MLQNFFKNQIRTAVYLAAWLLYALCHLLSMYALVDLPIWMLTVDAFVHAILFSSIGILFWGVIYYGNYEKLTFLQQIINYVTLGLLVIVLWLGIGYILNYLILTGNSVKLILPTMPVRALMGALLYLILMLVFKIGMKAVTIQEVQKKEVITESEPDEIKIDNDDAAAEQLERIVVKNGSKIVVVPVNDILYLQSDGDYVQIITANGKLLKEQTMKYFEQHLPSSLFVRIHRSYIINIESISRVELHAKQNQLVILKNGEKLKVSATGYKTLRTTLNL